MDVAAWFSICSFDSCVVSVAKSASITRPMACSVITEALLWLAIEKSNRLIREPNLACSCAIVCKTVDIVPIATVASDCVTTVLIVLDKPSPDACISAKLSVIVSPVVLPA